jgi:hypothetical protein
VVFQAAVNAGINLATLLVLGWIDAVLLSAGRRIFVGCAGSGRTVPEDPMMRPGIR